MPRRLAQALGYEYISGSQIRADLTLPRSGKTDRNFWLFSETALTADKSRLQTPQQDAEVDSFLSTLNSTRDHLVFDAWFLPWIAVGSAIAIYLDVNFEIRLERIRAELSEEVMSLLEDAIKAKDQRSAAYAQTQYGKDIISDRRPFQVVVNIQSPIEFDRVSQVLRSIAAILIGGSSSEDDLSHVEDLYQSGFISYLPEKVIRRLGTSTQ